MIPDFRAVNAYQQLLAESLGKQGVHVCFPDRSRDRFRLTRTAWSVRASVIHIHWIHPFLKDEGTDGRLLAMMGKRLLMDVRLARLLGYEVVWTMHNFVSHECRWREVELGIRRRLAAQCDRVLVHAESTRQRVVSEFCVEEKNVAVVPQGAMQAHGERVSREAARNALGIPQDAFLFVYIGLMRPYKNVHELLRTWRSFAAGHPAAYLYAAGEVKDPNYGSVVSRETEGLPNATVRLRRQSDEEVARILSAADVAVFPFQQIENSASVITAMSYGVPVIAPRIGGLGETLEGADDLMYDPTEDLASILGRALHIALEDLRDRTLGSVQRFSWDQMAKRTCEVYWGLGNRE